jgi:hypothetical protein
MKISRLGVLLAALAIAAGLGVISVQHAERQAAIVEACGAAESGDWNRVLQNTEGLPLDGSAGRDLAECRCYALLATERGSECESLMEQRLADPGSDDWSPSPPLAIHLIQTHRSAGRIREAADLARRAARRYPGDADLFYLELSTRVSVEDEEGVLKELEARIDPETQQATRMRVSLATRYLIRGDTDRALQILGPGPPMGTRDAIERWYDTRGMALANAGDLEGVRRTYDDWRAAGGDPLILQARYALTLSIAGLSDTDATPVELLRDALSSTSGVIHERLVEALATRLILTLVDADQQTEALAIYDRYRERFEFSGLTRDELERSMVHHRLASGSDESLRQTIRFTLPDPRPGSTLWISPAPDEPVDNDFGVIDWPESGVVEVTRRIDVAPVRWVHRSAAGEIAASGTVNPLPGSVQEIAIAPGEPHPPERANLQRTPADGNRRVMLILLDCADWRLIQYLRARGELPVLDAMLSNGFRAVLDSDPPLTAAALEALVWPGRRGRGSFVGLVHQLGVEIAGLSSVGRNPLDALAWILPRDEDLFSVIGSREHAAANLLFSHGGIRAGRHSEITGPDGIRRRLPIATSSRDLNRSERERWPGLVGTTPERDALHLRTIAAEFDMAEEIARAGEIDFLALRIEPLDILTHAHFAQTVRTGQDNGSGLLFEIYRYIDARLGETHNLLDEDDVFIVMSDHGIRTAMEHSRHALFVATGRGVPVGRADGWPTLQGVSAVVADLMGMDEKWPHTGVAPWAQKASASEEHPTDEDAG